MLKSEEWSFHSLWRVGAVDAPRCFIKSKVNQKILELFLLPADDELFAYGWFADRVIAGLTRLAWIPGRIYQSNLDVSNTSADAPWADQLHTPLHDTVILLMEPQPSTECINEMKLDTSVLSNLPLNDLKKYSNN